MTFPQTISASDANKETPINEQFRGLKWAGLFSDNPATTSGLVFGLNGGPMMIDGVLTTIADQTVTCTSATTNYVESTRAGVAGVNTTGFTVGRIPLYVVTTSAAGVSSFVDWRTWHDLPGVAGRLSLSVAGGANVTLTAAQARNEILNFFGLLTGNINVIVPDGPQTWCVTNNTTGAFTLTVKTSAGTGIAVTQGKAADLLADGTNVVLSNNDAAAIGGALLAANNLSDVSNAATARTNLGLAIGTHVQAYDAELAQIAALADPNADRILFWDDSAGEYKFLTPGTGLTITGTTLDASASGATELKGLTFTSDTDSTADSDPGAGLFKWNNATQASATFLYIDNATVDSVTVSTFWASLGSSGFIYIQQGDDATRWQLWKWTATPTNGTGYYKFAVTLQANSASAIQDAKTCYFNFTPAGGSSSGANMTRVTVSDSFTRPNDTTAYAAGDAVMDSTSAPTMMEFTGMAQANGGYGVILSATLYDSAAPATKGDFILWLYDTTLSSVPNDNAALANSDAESLTLVGTIYFPGTAYAMTSNSTSGAGGNQIIPSGPIQLDYKCGGSSTSLYGLLTVATGAGYTPIAQEIFTIKLHTEQQT